MGLITISQKQLFAPIYIFGKEEQHGRKQMLGALEAVFIRAGGAYHCGRVGNGNAFRKTAGLGFADDIGAKL